MGLFWCIFGHHFSRGQIFAHLLCGKIGKFRAYQFSRTFRFSNFENLKYGNRNERQGKFCENFNSDSFSCAKLKRFGTNFRAISRKSLFYAKMRESLSAQKVLRIRQPFGFSARRLSGSSSGGISGHQKAFCPDLTYSIPASERKSPLEGFQ